MRRTATVLFLLLLVGPVGRVGGVTPPPLEPGRQSWLHAHNCYPEGGQWADRIERALASGVPTAIEQDLVWAVDAEGKGQSIVSHGAPLTGREPTLEAHFFERVAPALDRALSEGRRDTWPVMVLHFDFKTNEPAHHAAVWALLGRYERWLTTAPRTADPATASPFTVGPLLVLTENGPGQKDTFHDRVPVGTRLRLFGTIAGAEPPAGQSAEARAEWAASASPETLVPGTATNYQRWTNFPWAVVERGGQAAAADWTAAEDARLQAIVGRAHTRGLWVRFYTLNGYAAGEGRGWSESYNFGSTAAVEARWRAVRRAGVDFVATDQYEAFAALVTRPAAAPAAASPAVRPGS